MAIRLKRKNSSGYVWQSTDLVEGQVGLNIADGTMHFKKADNTVITVGTGLVDIVNDTTPQLGGNLDVNGQQIISTANGNIVIQPNGTGTVTVDGIKVGNGGANISTNTAVGTGTLGSQTGGSNNTAIGYNSAVNSINGSNNTSLGAGALWRNQNNSSNTAIGSNALNQITTSSNIGIGKDAGTAIEYGGSNTIIGSLAGSTNLANTVLIGAGTTERIKVDSTGLYINGSAFVPGATNLDGLTDVVINTPTTNQVLKYDGTNWINATSPAGATDLNGLTDVAITSVATDQLLKYSGTEWVNWTPNYLTSFIETDPVFTAWDKSTGISITESQISDLQDYLLNVVEDLTPQLGGNLDVNGQQIVSVSNGNIVLAPNGTGIVDIQGTAQTDKLQIDTTATPTRSVAGLMWNDDEGTIEFQLKGGNVTLQIGQEMVQYVYNNTGSTLTDPQVVYISGSQGQQLTVALASASTESASSKTIGVVTESIAHEASGFITTNGIVHDLNTSAYAPGTGLWLSTTAGQFTATRPDAPNHGVFIGWVIRQHATSGSIYVHIQNGYELNELHDVLITSAANNQTLIWDSTALVWKNTNLKTINGNSLIGSGNITIEGGSGAGETFNPFLLAGM